MMASSATGSANNLASNLASSLASTSERNSTDSQRPAGGISDLDPYVAVRSQLIARKWNNAPSPRGDWFRALAKAGLTGLLSGNNGADYSSGMANFLTAAEIFGAYALPLSFAPAAGAAAALAACDGALARSLLQDTNEGGAPVLPALQSGAKTLAMGAGGGLTVQHDAGGGITVSGTRFAVPDAPEAQAFLAEAGEANDMAVFLFRKDTPGLQFSALPDAAGGKLGSFNFTACPIPAADILARGDKAYDLLDRMRFAVQLGLGAELAGLGAALMARAGESLASERDIANALMDVTLARAFVFGAAGMAQPRRAHALEVIAGARSAASDAVIAASALALGVDHGGQRGPIVERLSRRAIVASRIYRQPQAHRLRFVNWRWSQNGGGEMFQTLFAAASSFAAGRADASISASVADLIAANNRVRKIANDNGLEDDPLFRDKHGGVELDLMALVCADAQHQAGADISATFMAAAARRVAQKMAASALNAAGTYAAVAEGETDIVREFIAAGRCGNAL